RLRSKEELDEIDLTPETRATAFSRTCVSCRSIVSAEAPGKLVLMVTTGRSTSGNSRISTPVNAARPATMISTLITNAKTGRRMKSADEPPWFWCGGNWVLLTPNLARFRDYSPMAHQERCPALRGYAPVLHRARFAPLR